MMFPANVLQKIFKRFPLDGDGICVACNIQMRHKNAESFATRTGRKWVESLTAKAKRKRKLSLRLTSCPCCPLALPLFTFYLPLQTFGDAFRGKLCAAFHALLAQFSPFSPALSSSLLLSPALTYSLPFF